MLISLFRVTSLFDTVNNAVTRWMKFRENHLHEHNLQLLMSEQGLSEFAQILSGVPQGSILGPTLLLLFINNLPLSLNHCTADFYADNSTLHTSDKNKK